ncbi:bumetanide-sensitive sodium-(potassium)-chloride cotransporter isoform X2 [Diabrotica virgifera virgifera]|uniref:Bumetanide-sensitive sodium-(Potassium)-chloride cotransporter isoform X2 n=1 Tax=Diabrotica virgifera virgifera TaxID=50390 RepID=A0A6P7F7Y9_DIAVI|nr:bumetanide-sensitive sodium-(potassium)-chloride cotransporter isoform X2 [Diabrotica virgifera virgifera]
MPVVPVNPLRKFSTFSVQNGLKKSENNHAPDTNIAVEDHSESHAGIKLGWIQGVLIPCLLNIWGVMLFLRLSWVVAEAGIGQSLLIIAISAVVCIITTLSLSAICTNGEVKGGGIYYIISRSLGPEFGASVGVVFAFANAVSASMNTIGFCNSVSDLLSNYDLYIVDGKVNDTRIIGTVATLVMILICAVGMEWESKAQNFLIAAIVGAMVDFIVGTIIGPTSDLQRAQGFVGFNTTTFSENWGPMYRSQDGIDYNFFQVFAIFFPSVTGIQAGANISGDLKDPATAIPKGTLLSLLISMFSYALFVIFAGGAALRDASGNTTDLINGSITYCVTAPDETCHYGLFNSYQMMQIMSSWWPLIYAGCFAATLSTALTNLLSVPRLIQALGIDRIYPGLIFFSKGYGKHGEPYRGYVLTLVVSVAFLLIAELNAIAPLISNFYLASYALINFCTFHAALIKPLGWRPTFRYYNTWLSLSGFIMCVVIMFLINWWSSLITFGIIWGLYLLVVYRKPDVNWGSSTQAQTYKTALTTAQRLNNISEHVKNYKPQILVLCGYPQVRPLLIDFANLITKSHSLLIIGDVINKRINHRTRSSRTSKVYNYLRNRKIKAFYTIIDNMSFEIGSKALLQTTGIGKLSPNVLMMGYKNDWQICNKEELLAYFNVLHAAFDHRLAVAILRLGDGLDYGILLDDADQDRTSNDASLTPASRNELRTSVSSNIMHADSNLSLTTVGLPENNSYINLQTPAGSHNGKQRKQRPGLDEIIITPPDEQARLEEKIDMFRRKQPKGYIDVWWLYDDGGLTMLLPYIINTRNSWSSCKLRVFAMANNKNELLQEEKNMAHLLSKFRLDYYSLQMVSIGDKPQDSTIEFFNELLTRFITTEEVKESDCLVSTAELAASQDKTYRQLRLRELLLQHSSEANLIVMSLPMPRKGTVSAPLYMAWLEALTRDMPPYLLVRGNQQSVLTFYS